MIYFTAHTFKCVCHCRRAIFRVLGMYNFGCFQNYESGNIDAIAYKAISKDCSLKLN